MDAVSHPVWNAGTAPNPDAFLLVRNDGNAVIYSTAPKSLWANGHRV